MADPGAIRAALSEPANRASFEILRLLTNPDDSLAWAALLNLTEGVGNRFIARIYAAVRDHHTGFGAALMDECDKGFPGAPKAAAKKAAAMVLGVRGWLSAHALPTEPPAEGWGHWIVSLSIGDVFPGFVAHLHPLLHEMDGLDESPEDFGRFLSQVGPLGSDLASAKSLGVRFMTMASSKGRTVSAIIVAGLEDGLIPRPGTNPAEERRLLYVAMARAREHLYCTWARRRTGPTARSGSPNVGAHPHYCPFLRNGPVNSESGSRFLGR